MTDAELSTKQETCIQYTGLNTQQVIEFLQEYDAKHFYYSEQVLAAEGTWFVYEDAYNDVFRYTEDEFK